MAGPLGVSHLLLFSRSTTGNTNLRLALTPRGPTLHFRVERYSLCKDIRASMKYPRDARQDFLTPPLLVMNNLSLSKTANGFESPISKQLESLTTTVFQSLIPPISPQHTSLSSIRRVLIIDRELSTNCGINSPSDSASYCINLRHYAISTKKRGLSRGIRRLDAAKKPIKDNDKRTRPLNLGRLDDVAEYLLDPNAIGGGFTSGSESEAETDTEVEVLETKARKVMDRRQFDSSTNVNKEFRQENSRIEKRAIKLIELGPRMRLHMTKVEEGVCNGRVMWHEHFTKSKTEMDQMDQMWEGRRQEKEERRKVQKENVDRKKMLGNATTSEIQEDLEVEEDEEWDSDSLTDAND